VVRKNISKDKGEARWIDKTRYFVGSSWILVARVRFDFGLSTWEQGGGFLQASAPAFNDLAADVETWYSRKCRDIPSLVASPQSLSPLFPVIDCIARQFQMQNIIGRRSGCLKQFRALDSAWAKTSRLCQP